jgi:hypothetical protein
MSVVHYDSIGLSLYGRFDDDDNIAVNLTQGSGLNQGIYTLTDLAVSMAGLEEGEYFLRIFKGTAETQDASDEMVAFYERYNWDGTEHIPSGIDANLIELNGRAEIDGMTPAQMLAVITSVSAGNIIDSSSRSPKIRALDDSKNRVSSIIDTDGNRTNTINVSDIT